MKNQLNLVLAVAALCGLMACATPNTGTFSSTRPVSTNLAAMPEGVTSFAAATLGSHVYVCGGHKGERHNYSAEMVSGSFYRLDLAEGQHWEKLAGVAPAQGAPLVAHGKYLYRAGGMAARNSADQKQDLWSMPEVYRFDTGAGTWDTIAALPEPRSSHDSVVVDSQLYVGGGWNMKGAMDKPAWPDTALVLDLAHPAAGWRAIPQPFKRRALAMAEQGGRIYFIGGMDSDNKTLLAVDVYDPRTGQWTQGPELPAGPSKGFACSAIKQNGRIYANTFQGDFLRLSENGAAWEVVGRLQHPRMAHRLVTAGATHVVALGGEDGESKRPDLELFAANSQTPSVRKQALAH